MDSIRSRTASALRQIDASVQVSPKRKLTGFGGTCARPYRPFHTELQDHGRTMAGDLDDVFGRVRSGCCKPRRHDRIDRLPASSTSSASVAVRGSGSAEKRRIVLEMRSDSEPESRTTPMPPLPAGVEMATIVSERFNDVD